MVLFIEVGLPGPEAAKQPRIITLPPPCSTTDVVFPDKHLPKSPHNFFPKVLGIIKMFSGKIEVRFNALFAQHCFVFLSAMHSWSRELRAVREMRPEVLWMLS